MKNRLLATVAIAGLTSLAACNATATQNETNVANAIEEQADNTEALADNTSNVAASEQLENQADALEEKADNVGKGDLTSGNATNAM